MPTWWPFGREPLGAKTTALVEAGEPASDAVGVPRAPECVCVTMPYDSFVCPVHRRACWSCCVWVQHEGETGGTCRRESPVVVGEMTRWPRTRGRDWCAQWGGK